MVDLTLLALQLVPTAVAESHVQSMPPEILAKIAPKLKPYELSHFRDALSLKDGAEHYAAVTEILKYKRAIETLKNFIFDNRLRGKPLCPIAESYFSLVHNLDSVYEYMEECVECATEVEGKKYHIIDVGFDVVYEEDYEDDQKVKLVILVLVREEVNMLTKYKEYVSENTQGRRRRRESWGEYHVLRHPIMHYYASGAEWNGEAPDYGFENDKDIKWWLEEELVPPFSLASDGTVRQRRFVKTAAGETSFPIGFYNGSP